MKKADKILIVCIMIVAVVLCVPLFFSKNENVYASVYVKEKQVLRIDLSKDKINFGKIFCSSFPFFTPHKNLALS